MAATYGERPLSEASVPLLPKSKPELLELWEIRALLEYELEGWVNTRKRDRTVPDFETWIERRYDEDWKPRPGYES
jgi:hypothetical protein